MHWVDFLVAVSLVGTIASISVSKGLALCSVDGVDTSDDLGKLFSFVVETFSSVVPSVDRAVSTFSGTTIEAMAKYGGTAGRRSTCSRDGVVVKREGMRIGRLSPSQMEIRMLEIAVSWSLGYV